LSGLHPTFKQMEAEDWYISLHEQGQQVAPLIAGCLWLVNY